MSKMPDTALCLHNSVVLSQQLMNTASRAEYFNRAHEQLCVGAMRKLLESCVTSRNAGNDVVISLDVVVMTQQEINQMIIDAREEGRQDTMRHYPTLPDSLS